VYGSFLSQPPKFVRAVIKNGSLEKYRFASNLCQTVVLALRAAKKTAITQPPLISVWGKLPEGVWERDTPLGFIERFATFFSDPTFAPVLTPGLFGKSRSAVVPQIFLSSRNVLYKIFHPYFFPLKFHFFSPEKFNEKLPFFWVLFLDCFS